jgi:hypothetical protein
MAFMLYRTARLADGTLRYRYVHDVALAGDGLIYTACKKYLGQTDVGWTVSNSDLLAAGGHNASEHALVIDVAPKRPTVSLYEIRSISGYTYRTWTPLMLTMEMLFGDAEPTTSLEVMKREFTDGECERLPVREFLYLIGGYAEGSWNWGGNSRTTAALLFDDAWNYFQQQLDSALVPNAAK